MKKKSIVRPKNKQNIAISIDKGLKEEIQKLSNNVSDFINQAVHSAIGKCPTCGKTQGKG